MTEPSTEPSLRPLRIAIDGPASSGKSTVGVEAARRLGYRFCDTGLLYRAVTWLALQRGLAPEPSRELLELVDEIDLVADARGRLRHVEVHRIDVTHEVRLPEVDVAVSAYSAIPELRTALIARQRAIASEPGVIVAGRDIGTVILPDADLKIYLDASPEERARRRMTQRHGGAAPEQEAQILAELRRRDAIDSGREVAPLRIAPDAVVLHTDGNTFDETVRQVVAVVRAAAARPVESAMGKSDA